MIHCGSLWIVGFHLLWNRRVAIRQGSFTGPLLLRLNHRVLKILSLIQEAVGNNFAIAFGAGLLHRLLHTHTHVYSRSLKTVPQWRFHAVCNRWARWWNIIGLEFWVRIMGTELEACKLPIHYVLYAYCILSPQLCYLGSREESIYVNILRCEPWWAMFNHVHGDWIADPSDCRCQISSHWSLQVKPTRSTPFLQNRGETSMALNALALFLGASIVTGLNSHVLNQKD